MNDFSDERADKVAIEVREIVIGKLQDYTPEEVAYSLLQTAAALGLDDQFMREAFNECMLIER